VATFIEIRPLSTEISRHVKYMQVLTDNGRRTAERPANIMPSLSIVGGGGMNIPLYNEHPPASCRTKDEDHVSVQSILSSWSGTLSRIVRVSNPDMGVNLDPTDKVFFFADSDSPGGPN